MHTPFLLLLMVSILEVMCATQFYDGHFVIKRLPATCAAIRASLVNDSAPAPRPNCLLYNVAQLQQAFHYVTYVKEGQVQTYQLRMATLNVAGQIDNYDLSFHCPTMPYYGTPPAYCDSAPSMQLAALHVSANNTLYEMDIILSPAQYPPLESLAANKPPFGVARIQVPCGVPLPVAGSLQICKVDFPAVGCVAAWLPPRALPDPLPSNVGQGSLSLAQYGISLPSDWVADDANELLVVTAGTTRYFFNSAGHYLSQAGTCSAHTNKNYAGEMYTYDSRFLDFVGTVTVTSHFGYPSFQPVRVSLWVGLAFDSAKIDPVILYIDKSTGFYRGMDAFDIVKPPTQAYGASYWYSAIAATVPGEDALAYAARMANLSDPCAANLTAWLYPNATRTCPRGLQLRNGLCRVPSNRRVLDLTENVGPEAIVPLSSPPPALVALAVTFAISLLLAAMYMQRLKPSCDGNRVPSTPELAEEI
eukprot:EG_transcript_7815